MRGPRPGDRARAHGSSGLGLQAADVVREGFGGQLFESEHDTLEAAASIRNTAAAPSGMA